MASPLKPSTVRGPPPLLPRYRQLELSGHVLCNIARFCLRAHTLRIETGCWRNHNKHCGICDLHDVQDENRVLYLCSCLEMCYLRRKFAEQFVDSTDRIYTGDTRAFYFGKINAEDVRFNWECSAIRTIVQLTEVTLHAL